jgi:hypothetical protein
MVVLSEAQYDVLSKLSKGLRVTVVPPITRRWLQNRGYITVERPDKAKHDLTIQITDLGREVITHAVRAVKS